MHERGQVVGGPGAGHVRFAGAHAAREREIGIEAAVVDADGGAQIGVGGVLAEREALVAVFDHDASGLDSRQTAQHRAARETIENCRTARPGGVNARYDNGIRFGHLDASITPQQRRGASAQSEELN